MFLRLSFVYLAQVIIDVSFYHSYAFLLKRKVIPISILFGWIKFLLPRIMKEPVGTNSPVGADFET